MPYIQSMIMMEFDIISAESILNHKVVQICIIIVSTLSECDEDVTTDCADGISQRYFPVGELVPQLGPV